VITRKQFGKVIGEFQGMRFSIAEMRAEIEAARLLVYNAARRREAGLDVAMEASIAKLVAARTAERVSSQAIEWLGGVGITREFDSEKFLRDSKPIRIYEGTHFMQLETISKLVAKEYK
jgi:short-chain 2-methylacyl-CoA dehydrogenase